SKPNALNKLIDDLPYPDGKRSPVARWIEDAIKKEKMFAGARGAKTLLVLTDGADNISPNPFDVISGALKGQNVSLKIALFNNGTVKAEEADLKKAAEIFKGIRHLNPPGGYWEAEGQNALIEALKQAMQPQIRLTDLNGEPVGERDARGLR